jgi:CubicO group peptidase (beta-lactamase class C family)
VLKALKLKNLSVDTKIINYLPAYWPKGNNIDKITFRHLLTHHSGFKVDGDGSDYLLMKTMVMVGVSKVGDKSGYENMNFGLCRILIPVVMGYMDKDDAGGDILWDMVSVGWFKSFMQDKVFTPAGVANVGFAPSQGYKSANAYKFPFPNTSQPGWNSGNLASVSGGAGFRLSVSEVLKVLDHARRKGDILPATEVQTALDNAFGIDKFFDSPIGKGFYKKGRWKSGGRAEQSVIFFLPDNVEVVVFVNSNIGKEQNHVAGYVKNAYLNSLH